MKSFIVLIAAALFVTAFVLQVNLYPLQRYPGWDYYWHDARNIHVLATIARALRNFELPAIDLNTNFQSVVSGDVFPSLSILNLLSLFLAPTTVMIVRLYLFLVLGVAGAAALLRKITSNPVLSLVGGFLYLTPPFLTGMAYYSTSLQMYCLIPTLLLLIHKTCERPSNKILVIYGLFCFLSVPFIDVHQFVCLPLVIFLYASLVNIFFVGNRPAQSLRSAIWLLLIYSVAAAQFAFPLLHNLAVHSKQLEVFQQAAEAAFPVLPAVDFLKFFKLYGLPTFYQPLEGSGMNLYAPALFYAAIVAFFALRKRCQLRGSAATAVPILLAIGFAMLLEDLVLYSLLPRLVPGLGQVARGVLRGHLNLIPFCVILAGICALAALSTVPNEKKRFKVFARIALASLAWDLLCFFWLPINLFGTTIDLKTPSPLLSTNLISLPLKAPYHFFPIVHLTILAALLLALNTFGRAKQWGVVVAGGLAALLSITLQNELVVQSIDWHWVTHTPYRKDTYQARRDCIDRLVTRTDPQFRTLYSADSKLFSTPGRAWEMIAETELHTIKGEKSLFTYRETGHPYASLMNSLVAPQIQIAVLYPVKTSEVKRSLDWIKLMGARYILSADHPIEHSELKLKGSCDTPVGPLDSYRAPISPKLMNDIRDASGAGRVYVYELAKPLGIFFFTDREIEKTQVESMRSLLDKRETPWLQRTVYLEEPVSLPTPSNDTEDESVKETHETSSRIYLDVHTSRPKILVGSYIFHPYWQAFIDGERVPLYRAYGGFLAIQVPAGQHSVVLNYFPFATWLGFLVSLLAIPLAPLLTRSLTAPKGKQV